MVIVKLIGGLGNQLFQYALGRRLAHKNNTVLKLDTSAVEAIKSSNIVYYRLGVFNIQENFATPEELERVTNAEDANFDSAENIRLIDTTDAPRVYIPEILEGSNIDNVCLYGYWQREEYFKDIANILRQEFTLKNPLGKISNSWREKIVSADCAVSIHVRLGDYLKPISLNFGVLPMNYYFRCVNELKKILPKFTIFVFSNDLNWARRNLNFDVPTEFVEGCEYAHEEMYLMSLCSHNIISHSSFSWWGAWLNPNPNKKVFMPSNYLVTAEDFTVVTADYGVLSRLDFPPILSIIVYVDDEDIITTAQTVYGIFTQYFPSYEVIFLDANICESGEVYRKFATLKNMTVLKVSPLDGKCAAWNKGIELARGEYVLMLTGKDFIFPETVGMISEIWNNEFDRIFDRSHIKIDYEKFQISKPHIIFTYQIIEENPDGDLQVQGIADKKFALIIDETFKNLVIPTIMKVDTASKLALLVTKQLNHWIGTKIFSRSFLVENNILFDENLKGGGAELMFLIDAFMRTDRIIVVPQVFYGRMN